MRIFRITIFLVHGVLFGQTCHLQDFPNNWYGDTSLFVKSGNSIKSRGNPVTETIGVFKEIMHATHGELEVKVKLDFALSTSNYLRWVIAADSSNVQYTKALLIKWNGSTKNIQLQFVNGSSVLTLISGMNNRLDGSGKETSVKLLVSGNQATMFSDTSGSGLWEKEGDCTFPGFPGKWSGFVFSHTSTRADKLNVLRYCSAPPALQVASWQLLAADSLHLTFTTPVDTNTLPVLEPLALSSFVWKSDTSILLVWSPSLKPDQEVRVFIGGLQRADGKSMLADTLLLEWKRITHRHEIRITEILVDPAVHGPGEFVEIYNTTADTVTLKKWKLCDASSCATIPDIRIPPESFRVLASPGSLFVQVPSFPSLNNGGDSVSLRNENGSVIDNVFYSAHWWNDSPQDGTSIELLDANTTCDGAEMWRPCQQFHTAGMENSVHLNSLNYVVEAIKEYDGAIRLKFSLPMKKGNAAIRIDELWYEGIFTNSFEWISDSKNNPMQGSVRIGYPEAHSCLSAERYTSSMEVVLPERPQEGDIRISEILFNPVAYGYDYLELQNVSGKALFVDSVFVSNNKDTAYIVLNTVLSENEKLVWTEDSLWVMSHYTTCAARWVEEELPTFPDTAGRIYVWSSRELDVISYHEDWHNALLKEKESIAFERIQYTGPDQYQWISCADGGRPGCASPQYAAEQGDGFYCSSKLLSPDADERDDVMIFSWKGQQHLVRASLRIYSLSGIVVKELLKEELWEKDQLIVWDGSGKEGMLPADWYIAELLCENESEVKRMRTLVAIIYP